MARWASVRQVADYLQLTENAVRGHIQRGTSIGKLFYKVGGETLRADMDEIEKEIKGEE